jgi:hypothetical protein
MCKYKLWGKDKYVRLCNFIVPIKSDTLKLILARKIEKRDLNIKKGTMTHLATIDKNKNLTKEYKNKIKIQTKENIVQDSEISKY